jgi:hypothetical protein
LTNNIVSVRVTIQVHSLPRSLAPEPFIATLV